MGGNPAKIEMPSSAITLVWPTNVIFVGVCHPTRLSSAEAVPVVLFVTDLLLPAAAYALRALPGWPAGNQSSVVGAPRAGRRCNTATLRVATAYVRRWAAALVTLVASARARLLAAIACLAARAERAPRAIGRCETGVAAVTVDVKPFASRVVKLAALAQVVGRVLGACARLLRVSAQEALVPRMRARVGHDGTASRVHLARGRIVGAEARGRSNSDKRYDSNNSPHHLEKRTEASTTQSAPANQTTNGLVE